MLGLGQPRCLRLLGGPVQLAYQFGADLLRAPLGKPGSKRLVGGGEDRGKE